MAPTSFNPFFGPNPEEFFDPNNYNMANFGNVGYKFPA